MEHTRSSTPSGRTDMERRNDLIPGLSPIDAYGLLGFIAGYRPAAFDEAASRYGRRQAQTADHLNGDEFPCPGHEPAHDSNGPAGISDYCDGKCMWHRPPFLDAGDEFYYWTADSTLVGPYIAASAMFEDGNGNTVVVAEGQGAEPLSSDRTRVPR